jgi:hypothetical protein
VSPAPAGRRSADTVALGAPALVLTEENREPLANALADLLLAALEREAPENAA